MIPRVLKNFSVFIDGLGYHGLVDEAELPEVKIKMEEYRAGGMDGSYEIDMGQEAMVAKLTFAEYPANVLKAMGNNQRIQLRGALRRDTDASVVPVIVELGGRLKCFTPGSWKAGDMAKSEHEVAVDYFRWNQGGVDLMEIDVVNMKRVIGGVDQLSGLRDALAL